MVSIGLDYPRDVDVFEHLCSGPVTTPPSDLDRWFATLASCPFVGTVERALWAGFHADRLGFAVVGGYESALACLLGTGPGERLALAATESAGAHPRAIATRWEGGRLYGEKSFATLASHADAILVVASRGVEDGKNRLVVVRVAKNSPGLTISDRPQFAFAPEVPHARITLDGVSGELLPGDGYDVYLKPFRTIEDTHVLAAALGHVIREMRPLEPAAAEAAIAIAMALVSSASRPPSDPVRHVALAGAFTAARRLLAEHDAVWQRADPGARARWERDRPLLLVAENVRAARTAAAWASLSAALPT
jgi:acyl-CoA dehydrogenase